MSITDEELRERLGDKEDGWTERKSKGVSSEDIKKTLVAFANSLPDGHQGVLFIGISDKSGAVEGVDDPDKLQKNVRNLAERSIYPPIYLGHNCRVLKEAGKDVVAVIVEASNNRPHFAGASYVRVGSESVAASERQFEQLIASRISVARFILEAMRKDEVVLIEEFRRGRNSHRAQCKVEECNAQFANFRAVKEGWTYSAPLSKITASYEHQMSMMLFSFYD
jgi:predicted HTH transcriptional regulator